MISMSAISSAGGASKYYTEQARAEYYANEVVPSAWGGAGGEINGLHGEVDAKSLTAVLEGKVQQETTGKDGVISNETVQLGKKEVDKETGERKIEHRAGWDMTFAPPKSVSIESEVFGRQGVRDAHEAAVKVAMGYLEANASQTRIKGQTVETGNLLYASFAHATSRAGDPQTHTHVLIANVTYHDGKAYSLSNERLLTHRTTADAVYKNELAERLQEQGYKLEYDSRGNFEIAGYNKEHLAEFSKRSEQMEAALQERGSSKDNASYDARQVAALDTRDTKGEDHIESAEAHRERWQAEAVAAGIEPAKTNAISIEAMPTAKEIVSSAVASLADREQEFSKKDLVAEAMLQSSGRVSSGSLLSEIKEQERSGDLVQRDSDRAGSRYTTKAAIAGELWADKQISAGRDGHTQVMTAQEFGKALAAFEERKGFQLTNEQRQAASNILTGSDQFSGVQGAAGTGKTTMLELVREAAESKGWTVQGISNGAAQAKTLQEESGIQSTTTASFLATQLAADPVGQSKLLYVNDEASMSGQKEFNGVINATIHNGAKTVFVGDKDQHQSVAAGAAFERAQKKEIMQVSELKEMGRQKSKETQAPVASIMAGHHAEAIKSVAREYGQARAEVTKKWDELAAKQGGTLTTKQTHLKRDEIKEARAADNRDVIRSMAKDYAALSPAQRGATAVITGTNADRKALNDAIRSELKAAGALSGGQRVETLRAKDMTPAQAAQASSYQRGDVLKKEVARTGEATYFSVVNVDTRKNKVTIENQKGERAEISGQQAARMNAYTKETKEFAPGDRIAFFENAHKKGIQNSKSATVEKIEANIMTVKMDGRSKEIDLSQYKQIDHGYVVTSFKSQGQTVDRVMIHHNTEGGMHGQREAYVNNTRPRFHTQTYTQDKEKASAQAAKEISKTRAVAPRASSVESKTGASKDLDRSEKSASPGRFDLNLTLASYQDAAKHAERQQAGKEQSQQRVSTAHPEIKQDEKQVKDRGRGMEFSL